MGLGDLGLNVSERNRHIALDLGVSALGARLSALLDAPFVEQRYSRLVIDCNRALDTDGSIAAVSDGTPVPANAGLTPAQRAEREREVFAPYHAAISDLLAERDREGDVTILVSLHSFTPRMDGTDRPWQVGVLYGGGDERFARAVLAILQSQSDLVVGDNEPYRMDETDYTVPTHAFTASRPYVEIEVRQDELASEAGVAIMADVLKAALERAAHALSLARSAR